MRRKENEDLPLTPCRETLWHSRVEPSRQVEETAEMSKKESGSPDAADGIYESDFEDYDAMIQAITENIDDTNTEFESETSQSDDDAPPVPNVQMSSTSFMQPETRPEFPKPAEIDSSKGSESELWLYKDSQGCVYGPYPEDRMAAWFASGNFKMSLPLKRICDKEFQVLGEVIKAWGRVPFQSEKHAWYGNAIEDKPDVLSHPTASQTEEPRAPVSVAANHWQRGHDDFKFLRNSGPQQMDTSAGNDMKVKSHIKMPPTVTRAVTSRPMSAQRSPYPPLGICDSAELSGYDFSETPTRAKQHDVPVEGAWGGYDKVPSQRRPMSSTVIPRPSLGQEPGRQPSTWADVCQQTPVAREPWEEPQQPVVIENMATFPSLGGTAFTDSTRKKNLCHWERRLAADQDFAQWSYNALRALPSYVHVPTFFELLRDVDSASEIEEYVRMHLGDDDGARRFAQEFIRRRTQWKQLTGWKSPATVSDCDLKKNEFAGDASGKQHRRAQKVDSSMLGFVMAGEVNRKM